ncbi:MAG: GTPase HflX [Pseudomonadota bacterium]|nr:GTPase HflX [Pseudomonadota bacterium]
MTKSLIRERAIVLCPFDKKQNNLERNSVSCIEEAVALTRAINLVVFYSKVVVLNKKYPGTFFSPGRIKKFETIVRREQIKVAIIDSPLTPIQQRNLEKKWECKVIDRTGLILEIFGQRARSREGRLQVELAHLSYQRSRLVRSWTHLERQRGGFGFLGGPGETQIEADKRQIGIRINKIKKELSRVVRTRSLHRKARKRVPYTVVALVGYTNAGKSTLFNLLTGAEVKSVNQLFATLDPTMRALKLPSGRQIILSDTVGFLASLPTTLIAAFQATLEEVLEADLIIHVRDITHSDTEVQKDVVEGVLKKIGVKNKLLSSLIEVRNKIDLLDEEDLKVWNNKSGRDESVLVSSISSAGIDSLLRIIEEKISATHKTIDIEINLNDGKAIAWLYNRGNVLSRKDNREVAHFRVSLNKADVNRFSKQFCFGTENKNL